MDLDIFSYFFKGISVGFLASIPLGPIGVLCIQRTLSKSHRAGFISGMGAATADMVFALIAVFSLSVVMAFVENYINVLKVVGGICVIVMGVFVFLKNPAVQIRKNRSGKGSLWSDYVTMFFLTLTNPAFILMFVAMFAAFGVGQEVDSSPDKVVMGLMLVVGVLIGCSSWWAVLTSVVNLFRSKFRPRHLLWINRISGVLITLLGAITIISMFFKIPAVDNIIH